MPKKQGNFTLLGGRVVMEYSLYNPTSDAVWLAAFAPKGVKTVLDVGIGTGGVSLCLLQHEPDAQITGIDISDDMLKACKKNAELNNKQINLINADINKWSTPDIFDLVITNPPYFYGTPAEHNAHHNADITRWTNRYDKHMGDVHVFPLFSKKYCAERVLIRAKKASKAGTVFFKGTSMNNEKILRQGLTVGAMLATLNVL